MSRLARSVCSCVVVLCLWALAGPPASQAADGQGLRVVQSVPGLDLGEEPRPEAPDFYLALEPGSETPERDELLDVFRSRRIGTGVVHNRFAVLRVLRVYPEHVMARLESLETVEEGVVLHPRGVMVGDIARRRARADRPADGPEVDLAMLEPSRELYREPEYSELPWPPTSDNPMIAELPSTAAADPRSRAPIETAANKPMPVRNGDDKLEFLLLTEEPLSFPAGVLFELDKAELRPEARQALDVAAATFAGQGQGKVRVAGHTCDLGSDTYNTDLAKRRANAVFVYLASKGVSPERMTVEAFGESKPRNANGSEPERMLNRRVELHFDGPASREVTAEASPLP